ncbi:MAG: response regulator [Desulfobacterales bacterium]
MPNTKIIVVEDEKAIRSFMKNALTYCVDREVKTFEDGIAAWNYMKEFTDFHVVISDVELPGMSGFELLKKIKEVFPEKICIIMSGNPLNEDSASDLGADGFLAKPFKLKDLFAIVRFFMNDSN